MSLPAPETKVQRLFFALWPDDELRQCLKRHCKELLRHAGGRPVQLDNWHITLAFLGSVTAEQQACVEQAADNIRLPAFSLSLDQAGHWPRPRVLWVGARVQPEPLRQLATDLSAAGRDCGLTMDSRPFHAHLTLVRKVLKPPLEMAVKACPWTVDRFVLVRSLTLPEGVQYQPLRSWPLK